MFVVVLRMAYPLLCFYPLVLPGGAIEIRENFVSYVKFKLPETETATRNASRLTGGTPATRRRKLGGRKGSPGRIRGDGRCGL